MMANKLFHFMVQDFVLNQFVLSMGSFMPLPVVSSVEHLVTDTAAVGL
jgi:hypothetical protein